MKWTDTREIAIALAEAQVEAERVLAATESALSADGDLLSASERAPIDAAIDAAIGEVRRYFGGTNRHALAAATVALNRETESFAAKRMNRSIALALTGRSVDSLTEG